MGECRISIYQLSDYLWVLVYEGLEALCQVHNDAARSGDYLGGLKPVGSGKHRFRWIDFEVLLDLYFWDLDFLPYADDFVPTLGTREVMGMSDEVFGIYRGLEPHRDELRIVRVEPGASWECVGELLDEGSVVYPDPRFAE